MTENWNGYNLFYNLKLKDAISEHKINFANEKIRQTIATCEAELLIALVLYIDLPGVGKSIDKQMNEDKNLCNSILQQLDQIKSVALKNCNCFKKGSTYKEPKPSRSIFSMFSKDPDPEDTDHVIEHYGPGSCLNLAEICLFSAAIHLRSGSYLKGALNLRKAWKLYEKLLKHVISTIDNSNPGRYLQCGVKFGAGIFHFFTSLVPSSFSYILSGLGFTADRALGIGEIRESFRLNNYRSGLSGLLYLWIQAFYLDDLHIAEEILAECLNVWPTGGLYNYLGGYIARRRGDVDTALIRFQEVEKHSSEIEFLVLVSRYEIGWCHFLLGEYEDAASYIESFLNDFNSPSYVAWAAYQLGLCHYFLGDIDKAQAAWAQVKGFSRSNFSYDVYALRKSEQYENYGIGDVEKQSLIAYNQRKIGKFREGLITLEGVYDLVASSSHSSTDDIAYWATILYKLGNVLESINNFMKVIELHGKIKLETYLVSWSYYNCAKIELNINKNVEAASKYLKLASSSYSGVDFDKPLERKLTRLRDDLHNFIEIR